MADNKADMKGFLTQYFMQRVFNAMSDEQFAQYQDIIKNNDFIGNMKDWKDKWNLVVETAPGSGKWIKNETAPNLVDFNIKPRDAKSEEEWEKLYKELRNAFRKVAVGRDRLDPKDDKKTLEFLDAFYGFGQLFAPAELRGPAKTQLDDELLPFLKSNKTNLYQALKDLGIYTDSEKNFSDFISDLGKGKHNTDNDVRDTLSHIISYLRSTYYAPAISERMGGTVIPDFQVLADGLENDDIDAEKLKLFKANYKYVLNPIEREKNIFQNFAPHLKSVKEAIETARKRVDYNNAESKDFLKEKRPDEKGPIEKTVDNIKDWWGDHTDKYFSLHKSRLFYSDEAKAIAKAIDGAKFKPTDGLDKFVESLKTIGDKVKGNKAKQHFKWFSDTITKLHGDKQMSAIFAGALKNPRKLKELAAEFAIQGIKDGKKDEEIFTAMEVLKTIQYGYATSNHLNAVMKQDLTLFSDKSLSWNKHEGMSFVMTGLDKTINFSIKGTALLLTTGYNIINRNIGNKLKGNVPTRAAASYKSLTQKNAATAAEKQAEKDLLDKLDRENRRDATREKNATGITQRTLAANKRNLATLRTDEATKKTAFDTAQADFKTADDTYQGIASVISAQAQRRRNLKKIDKELRTLQTEIDRIDALGNTAKPSEIATLSNLMKQKDKLVSDQAALYKEYTDNAAETANALANWRSAKSDRDTADVARNTAQSEYNTASSAANDLDNRIEKFNVATQRIKDAKKRMDDRQKAYDKWQNEDKARFGRLMAHWDFLNSGRMRTGENIFQQVMEGILPLSQKDRQKRYNGRKVDVHDAFLRRYQSKYGLVA